jgi:hypothetical protein
MCKIPFRVRGHLCIINLNMQWVIKTSSHFNSLFKVNPNHPYPKDEKIMKMKMKNNSIL